MRLTTEKKHSLRSFLATMRHQPLGARDRKLLALASEANAAGEVHLALLLVTILGARWNGVEAPFCEAAGKVALAIGRLDRAEGAAVDFVTWESRP